jgi:hypothetical protein
LSRDALWEAMLHRRHCATTGAARAHVEAGVTLREEAEWHRDDPALGRPAVGRAREAEMGAILSGVRDETARFAYAIHAAAPIERVELRNRLETVELWRPYDAASLGGRIRVLCEGSEYRGRGRETAWRGSLRLHGNAWREVRAINRFNPDRRFEIRPDGLGFEGVTTGGFIGFEAMLEDPRAGEIEIATNLVTARLPVVALGLEDQVFEAGGLGRRMRAFRLPDTNPHRSVARAVEVPLHRGQDNAIFLRATLEDGNVIWTSPVYLLRA